MWSFRKKQQSTKTKVTAPAQQSMWKIWLLSIGTFVLTVLIVLGVFWVGRWVVHQFTKKSTTTTVQVQPATSTSDKNKTNASSNTGSTNSSSSSSTGSNNSSPTTTNQPAATTPAPASTTPSTSHSTLVNTGPTSDE